MAGARCLGGDSAHALLLFPRCRQFVEMVNGTDSEVCCLTVRSPKSQDSYPGSPLLSPRHGGSNPHLHAGGIPSSFTLFPLGVLIMFFFLVSGRCGLDYNPTSTSPRLGSDSPTCSNGITPTNKSKGHGGGGGVKYPSASSSASSSTSSSPSSVNYSESNSSDSTKSQPHSANSTQETRWEAPAKKPSRGGNASPLTMTENVFICPQ